MSSPPDPSQPEPVSPLRGRSERTIIFLVAAVQFINILDFVMVLPLGPFYARALGIPDSNLGMVGGCYTAAAAVAGLLGAKVLERFDRRSALGLAMIGLVAGTALGGFATGPATLYTARVIAGFFGGPATSLCYAVVSDVIPAQRRGRAVGAMMGAFSIAAVVGVPFGLWLAEGFGWRAPFFVLAALGLGVSALALGLLPPLRGHLTSDGRGSKTSLRELLSRRTVQLSYAMTAVVMVAGFLIIPNIATYLLGNLELPSARLKWLYLFGGLASFLALRLMGRMTDRFGSFRVGLVGSAMAIAVTYLFFFDYRPVIPVAVLFVGFMVAMGTRNVAYNTLTTQVPAPHQRATFQSIQSSVQHAASAVGAFLSSVILTQSPGQGPAELVGMPTLAMVSIGFTLLVPVLLYLVEGRVRARGAKGLAPRPMQG